MLGRIELTNKLVADKLKIEEREVCKVMSFVLQDLATVLHDSNHTHIYVRNLGTFVLRQRAVKRRLYTLCKARHRWKAQTDNQRKYKALATIEKEMFKLFDMRRAINKRTKEINGKVKNDNKG